MDFVFVRTGARRIRCRTLTLTLLAATCSLAGGLGCQEATGGAPARPPQPARAPDPGRFDDVDRDGLDDAFEDALAERFAPIVFHGDQETTYPINVEKWLKLTALSLAGPTGPSRRVREGPLHASELLDHTASAGEASVTSNGTRSRAKRITFVLEDVRAREPAAPTPGDWVTYVHSYPNTRGGVTLQYWRAYTRNDARFLGVDVSHGGDWEAIAVHLNSQLVPVSTIYLNHTGMVDWGDSVRWEATHPLVWSEEGGHSSYPDSRHSRSTRWFRHETWTDGAVTRWDQTRLGTSGGLRNMGEKTHPRNGEVFVQYSGLWGSRHHLFLTSGYWGPAFNETDARCEDGSRAYASYIWRRAEAMSCGRIFLKAWCDGADGSRLRLADECYATSDVP
jgi:hypothetical protein